MHSQRRKGSYGMTQGGMNKRGAPCMRVVLQLQSFKPGSYTMPCTAAAVTVKSASA